MRDLIDVVSSAQAVTAAAYSTGYKDKGLAALDYASGRTVYGVAMVTTTLTDGGANTGTEVYWYDAAPGTTFGDTTPVSLQKLGTFPQAAAVGAATSRIQTPLTPGLTTQQWMGFRYVPLTADLTGGKITAGFTNDPETWFAYAAAYSVLG